MANTSGVDVAQHLEATIVVSPTIPAAKQVLGPVLLVYGANVRDGAETPASEDQSITGAVPHQCVFVLQSSGLDFIPFKGGDVDTPDAWPGEENPAVTILVRGDPRDPEGTEALADAVSRAVDMNPPAGYFEARVRGGFPAYLDEDDRNRRRLSVTADLKKCR